MGKQTNVKMWAMILVIAMVASTFIGFSAMVVGTDARAKTVDLNMVAQEDIALAYQDRQLDMNDLEERRGMESQPTPMSPPPQPEAQGVWTYDFDADTVGLPPAAPPWNFIDTSGLGQIGLFGLDGFDDDPLGGMPDMPPWTSVDGSLPEYYWTSVAPGWEDGVPPGDIPVDAWMGTDGYFGTFDGSTLQYEVPHAGAPSGSISPGQTTGNVAAELIATAGNNYFGPAGFGSPSATTAYCGSWIYPTNTERIDIIIVEGTTWTTLIEVALYNNGGNYELVHWPGGTGTLVGQNVAINTWHELMVEYDEVADDYTIWWDGSPLVAGSAFMVASDNLDGMIWFAGGSVFNGQIDNWWHGQPPAGFTNNIEVVNTQSASPPHSIYIDQNNVAAGDSIASMSAEFTPMMAGTGYWDYYIRTDATAGDTNGAFAALTNQFGNDVIAVRANGGDFEYNDGGTWTTAMAFAASTWYELYITFDTVAKTFVVDIEGSVFGPASFASESGTLAGVIYRGTGLTQSEHYIDDVIVECVGQGPEIIVSDFVSHSAPNALRIQEYNADSTCYIAADQLGAGIGAVGQFSYWFYNTDNGGGNIMYLADGTNTMTIISMGVHLVDYSGLDGAVQFVNNDGTGLWIVDGPTYNPNEWHQITIDYDCANLGPSGTGQFTYSWDAGAPQGPYGMVDPATYMDLIEIDGNAPDTFGDFFYDDFYLFVNEMPGAPTNCWAEEPGGGVETWDNYTVDQDIPVEGTVVGTFNDINEKPPTAPDGNTQDITEALIPGGSSGTTLINAESFEGAWPPAGWTETGRWNGEAGPGTRPPGGGALCADFDGGAGQNGDLDTPALDLSGAVSFDLDFWVYMGADTEADDLWLQYYDNGGTWDPIVDLNTIGEGSWIQYFDTANSDPQYLHAGFQARWAATTNSNTEDVFVDLVTLIRNDATPPYCSLEHRWRTENVASGGMTLDLYVRARTDAGADDTFSIGIANAVGGPYTPVGITINMNVLITYSASIFGNSGVLYLNVIDDNDADPAQQDTVYIDAIWIEYYSMGGSVTTTQVAIADNPVDGAVTGTFADTVPPADGSPETISEVAAKSVPGPIPMSPGPGPTPTVDLLIESFDATVPPPGWTTIDADGDGYDWGWADDAAGQPAHTPPGSAFSESYVNGVGALNPDNYLITPLIDLSAYMNTQMTWWDAAQDPAWPNEHYQVKVSTTGNNEADFTNIEFDITLVDDTWNQRTLDLSAYDFQPIYIAFVHNLCSDWYQLKIDDVLITADVGGNTLEHVWTMQDMPADSLTRTLYVTGRFDTGSDDDFAFGWSDVGPGGPFTPLPGCTIVSDVYTTYNDATIPVAFIGPIWIQVIDTNGADPVQTDTVYIDALWIESEVSAVSTDIVIHWDLSSDDGAGENDIVSYDIYRADEEEGDDITGPYTFIGSSPAGATTYNDIGEGSDLSNQAWYYVEANDGSQTNASGYFSKLNFPPVAQNLLTNGMTGLIISPFTPSIILTADANDTSNHYEAIPQMFMAEYFINVDPGEGAGIPMNPVDAVWDTYIEPIEELALDSSTWTPGTYTIGVRVAEIENAVTIWGPVSFITVDVVDGPPIANAGFDQQVPQHTLVTFDGSLSSDDVGITNYWWNFTDVGPQTLTTVSPTYTFDNEGIFTVTLTVMDTVGQTNSDIMEVNVTDGDPPVAEAGPDQQVTPGDIVTFDGTASYDPGHLGEPIIDGIVNWTWTFDDGTGPQTIWGSNPTHQFNVPGVYTVTLTVADNAPPVTGGPYYDADTMVVTVVQIFDIDISPAAGSADWILVSFPNQVSGDPLVIVQDAIDAGAGLVTWDIIQTYNGTTGEWLTTSTFKPASLNTFTYVDNFHAFWIHITNYGDNLLTITGALATSGEQANVPLKAGWNLVGYPFGTAQEMFNTFGTLFSLDRDVEVYDQLNPYRLRIADVWTEWHNPGAGHWVHVAFDETMVIWSP